MTDAFARRAALAALVIVYIGIYVTAVFARVTDVEFMNVDPRSVTNGINALARAPVYNMHGHYHSIVYGWTYFALNHLALIPVKALGFNEPLIINTTIRAILFTIGLGITLTFYAITRRLFTLPIALLVSLFFVTNHIVARWFVEIHPESTGLLFYLLGILFLHRAVLERRRERRNYVVGMIFLSFSALAKQPFAIIALFTWFGFFYAHAQSRDLSLSAALSRYGARLFFAAAAIFLVAAFLIHPYAFLEFDRYLQGQLRPLSHASGNTLSDVIPRWWAALIEEPLAFVNGLLLLALPFSRSLRLARIFRFSLIATVLVSALFMFMEKLVPRTTYLYPLYPLYFLHITYVFVQTSAWARPRLGTPIKVGGVAVIIALAAPFALLNAVQSMYLVHSRFILDGYSTKNLVWEYLQNVPESTRIAIMPTIAVPPGFDKKCHIWRRCRSAERMADYAPDIVFASWKFEHLKPAVYRDYIADNRFRLERTFEANRKLENSCGYLGDYFHAYYGLRVVRNPARRNSKQAQAFRARSMFENFHIGKTAKRIAQCGKSYMSNIRAAREAQYSGYDIDVWVRPGAD